MPKDALKDIELLLRSRYGLLHLETEEEDRAGALLAHVADRMGAPFFSWTHSRTGPRAFHLEEGLCRPISPLSCRCPLTDTSPHLSGRGVPRDPWAADNNDPAVRRLLARHLAGSDGDGKKHKHKHHKEGKEHKEHRCVRAT